MGASVVVLGASGYVGGEILRLLERHPAFSVVAVAGDRNRGSRLGDLFPNLSVLRDLEVVGVEEAGAAGDVCFSCLPHGGLPGYLDGVTAPLIVDLADDFRATDGWVYGVPELDRASHVEARRIANPGCYPTAALLCLVPFARAGVVTGPVIVDALSGLSGAGRSGQDHLLFANAAGGASAYGTVAHRHVKEMERGLETFGSMTTRVSFTPHLVPMARGVLVTARASLASQLSTEDALEILVSAYAGEPFVEVTSKWPGTKAVAGTNRALVTARVDARAGLLVAAAAIDNLGKGAAGQAVQNANLALGWEEALGLEGAAVWP